MKALLVSSSAPEMDRLAVELASRGSLAGLVRRYANKGRWWERALARIPLMGRAYAATLGRRLPPAGLEPSLVREAGIATDFAAAAANRAARRLPELATRVARLLQSATEHRVAREGGRQASTADVVVASYHVAYPALRRARQRGVRTVLNYPIAHHRWQYRFYAEQARRYPEFAPALPNFGSEEAHAESLDREIALADMILVGSTFVRDTFVSEGIAPERLRVIPYGADVSRFRPAATRGDGGPFRVLFVGQIGERKGISHLLKAYEAFRKPDTELHLVGDFVNGNDVYRRYRHLFTHTKNLPQAQLPDLFRAAHVFVFPTLVEGMGMVVLEAMACGVPVIVTPNGPGDIVRDGVDGFVVPTEDPGAIVDRLGRLYDDSVLRARLAVNAREGAEHWSWARYSHDAAEAVLAD